MEKTKRKRTFKRALSLLSTLGICAALFTFGGTVSADAVDPADKIDPILQAKIQDAGDTETFPVMLWLTDIDDTQIEAQAAARTQIRVQQYQAKAAAASAGSVPAEPLDETQVYIEEKRAVYAEQYAEENQEKFNDIFPATRLRLFTRVPQEQPEVVYSCVYAPTIKLNMTKAQILTAAQSNLVDMVYDDDVQFEDIPLDTIQPLGSSATSNPSVWQGATNAALVRDTYGLTGAGVKIGQIEAAVLDFNDSRVLPYRSPFQLQWASGTFVADTTASNDGVPLEYIEHAAQVASIMVGRDYNGVKGIAPNAYLYSTNHQRSDDSNYQGGFEWLLSQGVNIINMSARLGDLSSTYSSVSRWLDHIAIHHDVTVVVTTGNSGANAVNQSAMAYNVIAVGALDDKNSPRAYRRQRRQLFLLRQSRRRHFPAGHLRPRRQPANVHRRRLPQ